MGISSTMDMTFETAGKGLSGPTVFLLPSKAMLASQTPPFPREMQDSWWDFYFASSAVWNDPGKDLISTCQPQSKQKKKKINGPLGNPIKAESCHALCIRSYSFSVLNMVRDSQLVSAWGYSNNWDGWKVVVFLQLSCDMQYITLLLSKKILYTSLAKGLILGFSSPRCLQCICLGLPINLTFKMLQKIAWCWNKIIQV